MKIYNISYNVGSSKYVVNFYDGINKHKDGSDFYDLRIFKNERKFEKFQKELIADGYVYGTPMKKNEGNITLSNIQNDTKQQEESLVYELLGDNDYLISGMSAERVIEYALNRLEANPEDKEKWEFNLSNLSVYEAIAIIKDYGETIDSYNAKMNERVKYLDLAPLDNKVAVLTQTISEDKHGYFSIQVMDGKNCELESHMSRSVKAYDFFLNVVERHGQKYKIVHTDINECSEDLNIEALLEKCISIAIDSSYQIDEENELWNVYFDGEYEDGSEYPFLKRLKIPMSELSTDEAIKLAESLLEPREAIVVNANNEISETVERIFGDCAECAPDLKENVINDCVNTIADDFWENYSPKCYTRENLRESKMYPYSCNDIINIKKIAEEEAEKYLYWKQDNGEYRVLKKPEFILDITANLDDVLDVIDSKGFVYLDDSNSEYCVYMQHRRGEELEYSVVKKSKIDAEFVFETKEQTDGGICASGDIEDAVVHANDLLHYAKIPNSVKELSAINLVDEASFEYGIKLLGEAIKEDPSFIKTADRTDISFSHLLDTYEKRYMQNEENSGLGLEQSQASRIKA